MKLTTGIILLGITAAGTALAQSPAIVQVPRTQSQPVRPKLQTHNQASGVSSTPSKGPKATAGASQLTAGGVHGSTVHPSAAIKSAQSSPRNAPAKLQSAAKKVPGGSAAKNVAAGHSKIAVEAAKTGAPKTEKTEKKDVQEISLTGRRDPFISPVVNQSAGGSGCSTGKRCLAIDQINLKGIVKSENGMIAVVVNALDKAYFLHENDPVFNGYVVRITEDSIVFKETVQDKLGKPFTREVTKRIITPAV
jgi:Tfp pilus assembly protein PilP